MNQSNRAWVVPFIVVVVAIALIVLANVVVNRRVSKTRIDTITVDGKARRVVNSDYAIWTATITAEAPTITAAYGSIRGDSAKVQAYLKKNGLVEAEILPQAITSQALYAPEKPLPPGYTQASDNTYRPVVGYQLTQDIEVRTARVGVVDQISRSATELISEGIPVQSSAPMFLVSNLAEVKDSILAEAAKNAYVRAKEIADSSHASIAALHYSHMGLVTVTDAYGASTADDGTEDTTSLEKTITVEVSSAYDIK